METKFDIDLKLIDELAKSIKSQKDLAALSKHLLKLTVERAMSVAMKSIQLRVKIAVTVAMATRLRQSRVILAKLK